MIYIWVFVFLSFLMYYYDIKGNENRKEFWYKISLFTLIVISGLRYRIGGDSVGYMYGFYHDTPYIWDISWSSFKETPFEPLFFLFNSIVKTFFGKFFVFQFLHAIFVNSLIFLYIKKHSNYIFTCIWFYFIWMYPMYNFEEMRASMSLAICLFANDYIIDKKWFKGFGLYLIGCMFHYSTFVILLTPFLFFLRMNYVGYIVLFLAFMGGFILQKNFEDYLVLLQFNDFASEKASVYAESDFYFQQNKTIRGIVMSIIPYMFYSAISFLFLKKTINNRSNNMEKTLLQLQPFILLGLIFLVFSIPMPICYRFVRFYIIYFILLFSYCFIGLIKRDTKLSASIALARSLILFLPLFNIISYIYRDPIRESTNSNKLYNYEKYYPYSSILDKRISERREKIYKRLSNLQDNIQPKETEY